MANVLNGHFFRYGNFIIKACRHVISDWDRDRESVHTKKIEKTVNIPENRTERQSKLNSIEMKNEPLTYMVTDSRQVIIIVTDNIKAR